MPKKRQIPFLFPQTLADRNVVWHWKPSARLRKAGFVNVKLGSDDGAAMIQALDLNKQVRAWEAGNTGDAPSPFLRPAPRVVRFGELVTRYRASPAFTDLKPSTRHEYNTRLRQLEHWAIDGSLPVRDIDRPMVRDLRTELLARSPFVTAGTLRVLRLLLAWAVAESIVRENVASDCNIPEPPKRRTVMDTPARDAIIAAATRLGFADMAFALTLAFWTIQRQGDLLSLNRMSWREALNVSEIDGRHAAVLADARGRIMVLRLGQQKTGVWVDAPIPPMLHADIEAALASNPGGWLFHDPHQPDNKMPRQQFQRRYRLSRAAAAEAARAADQNDLAEAIEASEFRDLRRTGMTFYGNMGAKTHWITALSGHCVLGKKSILDTYMPGDTAGACACVATGLIGLAKRQKREKMG